MSDAIQQLIRQAEVQKLQMEMNVLLQKNLALFKERMPQVYKMVENHKPENFILRLDHHDKLNLLDQKQQRFLYNEDPMSFSKKQVAQFQEKSQVRRFRITKNKEYNDSHLHIKHLNLLLDEYESSEPKRIHGTPNFISSLIVSGVGLGHHLGELIECFDIQNIIIHEKCIDAFHGSLHVMDWTTILDHFRQANRSVTVCVGVEPEVALAQIESIINKVGLHSQMFTFVYRHTMRSSEQDFIEYYQKELRAFVGGIGYYDDEQIGLAHAYHNLKSESAVFMSGKTHSRKPRLLLIGNGPSLDEHRAYIEKNRDNVVIMSCGTALSSLLKMGISPDFHVEMERCIMVNDVIKYSSEKKERDDITLLCLHTVAPETIRAFPECCYAIKSNDAGGPLVHDYYLPKKVNELVFCNPTVANCGLSFAVSMGFEDIHLVGIDFGVKDGGKHHSKHSVYSDMEKQAQKDKIAYNFFDEDKAIICEGNFGGEVMSSNVLNMARVSMERFLNIVKPMFPNLRCTNTNNGAKINHTVTLKIEDLPPVKKCNTAKEVANVKKDHFLYEQNDKFLNKTNEELLKYFYSIKEQLKISTDISTEKDLYAELRRAYKVVGRDKDAISNALLRGSLNTFFGSIVENSMYCVSNDDFKKRTNIGATHFNEFIEQIYIKMNNDPFKLDETDSPFVQKMHQERQDNPVQNDQ